MKKSKIEQIKAVIFLKENKIPKKYLNSLTNKEIYKDFVENGVESLINWAPTVIKDSKVKIKIASIQEQIVSLIKDIEGKNNEINGVKNKRNSFE